MKILVVDSDSGAIEALVPVLRSIPGSEIYSASNGGDAMSLLPGLDSVDVLVANVFMEPMNGFTLRNKVQNRHPEARALFMSSYPVDDYADLVEGAPVLIKPFDADELIHAVTALALQTSSPSTSAPPAAVPEAPVEIVPEIPDSTPESLATPLPVEMVPEQPAPAAQSPAPSAPEAATALVGQTLGNYKITSLLSEGHLGFVYEATQTSMNRPVALKVLSPALQQDANTREQFIADAQAKANVQHPSILAVYEAGESGPYCYYTLEYVDGANLLQYIRDSRTVDDALALQLIRTAGSGLLHLDQKKISHAPLELSHLYIDGSNRPRLANIAIQQQVHTDTQSVIIALAGIVKQVLPGGRASDPGLQGLIQRMSVSGNQGFLSWGMLLQSVKALAPKVIPADAIKISEKDVAAIRAVEETRQRRKLAFLAKIIGPIAGAALIFAVWYFVFRSDERNFELMVQVPAGEFTYQDGAKVNLPAFWIDQYEVTIGQYAKFLKYLDTHPGEATKFDHPKQPAGKSHKPAGWDEYYSAAKAILAKDRAVKSVPVNLNSPVFGVTWWDAYAYAKWKGRRLPTEQEWEKAARGTDGRVFPWGNEFNPKKTNSSIDFNPDPTAGGGIDGANRWNDVDATKGDVSPYNVFDMAGNVSEWTDTWDGQSPVIRGGSYHSVDNNTGQADVKITRRVSELPADHSSEYLGFRTASSTPPPAK